MVVYVQILQILLGILQLCWHGIQHGNHIRTTHLRGKYVTHGEGKMLQFLRDVCQTLQVSFGGYFPSITLSSTMGLLML